MSEHEGSFDNTGHSDNNEGVYDQELLGASSRFLLENMERLTRRKTCSIFKEAQRRRAPQRTSATSTVTQPQPTPGRIDTLQGVRGRRPGCCYSCGIDCMVSKPDGSSVDTSGASITQPKISNIGNHVNTSKTSIVPENSVIVNQIGCLLNVTNNVNSPLGRLKCNYKM